MSERERFEPNVGCDDDGDRYTVAVLAAWLDTKYRRHGEREDKAAADMLRALAARSNGQETAAPPATAAEPAERKERLGGFATTTQPHEWEEDLTCWKCLRCGLVSQSGQERACTAPIAEARNGEQHG